MRCENCQGKGYFEEYFTCPECNGSGITSCCEGNPNMAEQLTEKCPYCQRLVTFEWDNGVVSKPEYVLIADWVYHTECWNEQMREYPPEEQPKQDLDDESEFF
jgi:RecJ-like exonuclease